MHNLSYFGSVVILRLPAFIQIFSHDSTSPRQSHFLSLFRLGATSLGLQRAADNAGGETPRRKSSICQHIHRTVLARPFASALRRRWPPAAWAPSATASTSWTTPPTACTRRRRRPRRRASASSTFARRTTTWTSASPSRAPPASDSSRTSSSRKSVSLTRRSCPAPSWAPPSATSPAWRRWPSRCRW